MFDQSGFEQAKQDFISSYKLLGEAFKNSFAAIFDALDKGEPSWNRLLQYLPEKIPQPFGQLSVVGQAELIALLEGIGKHFEDMSQRLSNTSNPDEFIREMKAINGELEEEKRRFGGD